MPKKMSAARMEQFELHGCHSDPQSSERRVTCGWCEGTGESDDDCEACDGYGHLDDDGNGTSDDADGCEDCAETGKQACEECCGIGDVPCPECTSKHTEN